MAEQGAFTSKVARLSKDPAVRMGAQVCSSCPKTNAPLSGFAKVPVARRAPFCPAFQCHCLPALQGFVGVLLILATFSTPVIWETFSLNPQFVTPQVRYVRGLAVWEGLGGRRGGRGKLPEPGTTALLECSPPLEQLSQGWPAVLLPPACSVATCPHCPPLPAQPMPCSCRLLQLICIFFNVIHLARLISNLAAGKLFLHVIGGGTAGGALILGCQYITLAANGGSYSNNTVTKVAWLPVFTRTVALQNAWASVPSLEMAVWDASKLLFCGCCCHAAGSDQAACRPCCCSGGCLPEAIPNLFLIHLPSPLLLLLRRRPCCSPSPTLSSSC